MSKRSNKVGRRINGIFKEGIEFFVLISFIGFVSFILVGCTYVLPLIFIGNNFDIFVLASLLFSGLVLMEFFWWALPSSIKCY